MEIYQNDTIILEEENNYIYVTVLKRGFSLRNFTEVIKNTPTIKITKQLALQEALVKAANERVEIGVKAPVVELSISKNKLRATILLNCTAEELRTNHELYVKEVLKVLHQERVSEGILVNVIHEALVPQREIVVARGREPINGEDAKITYFQLSERKPTIRSDGKADYYDMNFIDEVKKGDWLGEKIPPTSGEIGTTVTGEMLTPKKGRDLKLNYDRKTVGEYEENGKTVLRALIDGVVTIEAGKIAVGDHLVIDGDVGVETGNIEFDGSVTCKGVVQNGYSIMATKDISILGEMGLSGVKSIISEKGDIYIKGGIFGQGQSFVSAGKNIFVKHANDVYLHAKEDIHIGYYAIGSHLQGRHILADEKNGKIIGGKTEAKGKIVASIIGNRMERKTILIVQGFDRRALTEKMEQKLLEYKKGLLSQKTLKNQIEAFENSTLNDSQRKKLDELQEDMEQKLESLAELDGECKYLMNLLEVKGEGEITILDIAHPETYIEIKGYKKRLTSSVKGSFVAHGGRLGFE